ncbi:MAG: GNAT family N-acetyltransferase [Moraxellaceae bacterium]|nr:GNAT family N-acetyltransferase [Pseudobdellovibrionaceae bacterium]
MEKIKFLPQIITERLVLRRHDLDQAETVFRYIDQDRQRLRQFLPWVDETKTVDDSRAYIQLTLNEWETSGGFDFGIFRKSDGLYLGNAGVHTIDWINKKCELGYWILGQFEGQGYVSEAVVGLQNAAFDAGFNCVQIRCSTLNIKSASVPKRLNYKLESLIQNDLTEQGVGRDTLVFSLNKKT